MSSKRFSIIIPIYNLEKYISECINSVLEQSFKNYEIILVNDGSIDNTLTICQNYENKYNQIKLINKANGGLSDARNVGIRNASAEYIIFLDGDDFFSSSNFLFNLDKVISVIEPDLVIYYFSYFFQNGNIIPFPFDSSFLSNKSFKKDINTLIKKGIYNPSACNKCIKRSLFSNSQLDFPLGRLSEDILWCSKLATIVDSYEILNDTSYMYRQNREGSITYKISEKNILHILKSVDEGIDNMQDISILDKDSLYRYFSYSYLEIIPYINQYYRTNQEIKKLLLKHKFLIDYGMGFYDKRKKIISFLSKIFGIYISSFILEKLVYIYRAINNKIKD